MYGHHGKIVITLQRLLDAGAKVVVAARQKFRRTRQ